MWQNDLKYLNTGISRTKLCEFKLGLGKNEVTLKLISQRETFEIWRLFYKMHVLKRTDVPLM